MTLTSDDLATTVSVTASDPSATEAGLTTGRYTFTRTGGTTTALTVNYTRRRHRHGRQRLPALGTSVSFAAGATTATKTVTPLQDSLIEANETVLLTLAPGTGYTVGTPASATVTLTSDDLATTVSVSASDPSATEAGLTTGRYTFTRTGGTTTALTVNYTRRRHRHGRQRLPGPGHQRQLRGRGDHRHQDRHPPAGQPDRGQ